MRTKTYVIFMQSVRYCCPALTKMGICLSILTELSNIKFRENPFSRSRVVPCRDRHSEANSCILQVVVATATKTVRTLSQDQPLDPPEYSTDLPAHRPHGDVRLQRSKKVSERFRAPSDIPTGGKLQLIMQQTFVCGTVRNTNFL
jgi:hypothetical protein